MTIRTTNTKFLAILDPLPRENIGWWAEVYDSVNPNTLLGRIYDFESLSFMDVQSDTGIGTVTFLADDPVLTEPLPGGLPTERLLTYPAYWRLMDDGVERFRFFYEGKKRPRAKDVASPIIAVSGRGRAEELEFGTILPANWPTQTKAVERKYVQRTWAYIWLELLAEAKARGAVPTDIQPTFTATTDSKGAAWTDLGDHTIPVGGDLLSLLKQFAEAVGFDWRVAPNGAMTAAANLGFDRTGTVRFFEGVDVQTAEDLEDLQSLRNDVYVQAQDGTLARAVDGPSISRYRRRETFIPTGGAGDVSAANLTANGALRQLKDPISSRTYKVPIDPRDEAGESIGRRLYVDYAVSDTIGYGPKVGDGSSDFKLVAAAVTVTAEGPDLEITVQSKRELLIEKMKRLLAKQLGGAFSPSAAGGSIQSVIKQTISANTTLAELSDVDVSDAIDQSVLAWSQALSRWVDTSPSLNFLTDVDLTTPPTDGQALLYDDASGLWKPGTVSGGGGGGGGGGSGLPLDAAPGTPHAKDDEFAGSTLDAKWVQATSDANNQCAPTVADGWVRLDPTAAGSGSTGRRGGFGIRQVAPTGSFTVTAKIADSRGGDDARVGLFVASTSASKGHIIGSQRNSGRVANANGFTYSDTAEWGGYDGFDSYVGPTWPGATWFRIRWDAAASTLWFDFSTDGVFWTNLSNRTGQAQPNRCGIALWANSANIIADHALGCDWFRVTEP